MCISPNFIWVQAGPGYEKQTVSCRQCWRCRKNKVNDYVGRSLCEAAYSVATASITLTYAPRSDFADKVLHPIHFQKFIRSLRRRGHHVRYLVAGEYGERKGRAHFHAILFFKNAPPQIPNKKNTHIAAWPHGHVFCDWDADEKALRYVCKYILKDVSGARDEKRPISEGWFSLSKKPALGHEFFMDKAEQVKQLRVIPRGFTYLPPGGKPGVEYLMTGATRRDYLNAITQDPAAMKAASEWVVRTFDSIKKARDIANGQYPSLDAFMQQLQEEQEKARPKRATIVKAFLDTYCLRDVASQYGDDQQPLVSKQEFHKWLDALDAGLRLTGDWTGRQPPENAEPPSGPS